MSSYSSSYDTEALAASMGIGMVLLIYGVAFLISIAIWIVQEIPFYKMAKNQGMSNAWLAFIPYGNFWVQLKLSPREFNLFNWIRWDDRAKAFWAMLIATGIYIVLLVPVVLLLMVPVIGILIYIVYIFAYVVFEYGIIWRMNYDILITYGMEQNAMLLSILNIFCPIIMIVCSYMIMNREPNYNA